jgi:hypothetical protein
MMISKRRIARSVNAGIIPAPRSAALATSKKIMPKRSVIRSSTTTGAV